MALTAIHLNQVQATTAPKSFGIEWLRHARAITIGLLVGSALFVAAPFALHAATVRPANNAQLTSAVTTSSAQFPAVVSGGSPSSYNGLPSLGTITP